MSEKKVSKTETYSVNDDEKGVFKTSKRLEQFGEKQNEFNKLILEALTEMKERINKLEEEQKLNVERFKKCAAELQSYKGELDRIRLDTQLNSNAIDRILKDEKENSGNSSEK